MSRTPEQVKADDALTEAINAVHRAYHDDSQGVLTTYLVLAHRTYWGDNGERFVSSFCNTKDSDVPLFEQLGMIEYARTPIRMQIADSYRNQA